MSSRGSHLTMAVSKEGTETVLALAGELDLYTAARLREQLVDLTHGARPKLVIDLKDLEFVDSTGLGTLVGGASQVRQAGGDMVLRAPSPSVRRSIEVMGLAKSLTIRD